MDKSKKKEQSGIDILGKFLESEDSMECSKCSTNINFDDNFVFTHDSRLLCRSCFEHSKCN